jgi:DNA-binding transcriptional ArsR family regulator
MNDKIEDRNLPLNLVAASPACKWRIGDLGSVLRAIANPTRRQILALLAMRDLSVSRIASQFSVSRRAIIKHLQILYSADLISVQRSGRNRIQRLNAQPLKKAEAWISGFAAHADNSRHQPDSALKSKLQ